MYPYDNQNMYQSGYGNPYTRQTLGTGPSQVGPNWIMVATVAQVEQVSVQPNQKAWIMVQNEPIFALRTADQMGLVNTDYYRFEKYNPNDKKPQGYGDFVTRKEMEDAINMALERMMGGIKNESANESY